MGVTVKTINIQAFRGVPELQLKLQGKNLVLRGENGMGKSSIVEALEFFFTGGLSSFEGSGTQALSLPRHGPHKDFDRENVRIEIVFDPGAINLLRSFEESPSPPKQLVDYFNVAKRGTFILRRAQVLKFVYSRPAHRFRAIASILGIEPLDDVELEMKHASDELKGRALSKQNRIVEILGELSELLGKKISNMKTALSVINDKLEKVGLSPVGALTEMDKPSAEMLGSFKETQDLDQILKINEILGEIKTSRRLINDRFVEDINRIGMKASPLVKDQSISRNLSIMELLNKGRQVVEDTKRNICPLCQQAIKRKALLKNIEARLQTLRHLSRETLDIRTMTSYAEDRIKAIQATVQSLILKTEPFPKLKNIRNQLLEQDGLLNSLATKIKSAKELKERVSIENFGEIKGEFDDIFRTLSKECKELLHVIVVPEGWKKKLEVIQLIEQVKNRVGEFETIQKKLELEEKRHKIASKIYSIFTKMKNEKVREIYRAITEDLDSFYSRLHPDDPHKNIELGVVMERRASSGLTIESFGREGEDPRAYTSEGHQDSLGLCIFLAFVKKFNAGCGLIVLDDVVSTIDAQHREHICELLLEEFKDYQLLITTHDEVWYNQLRAYQRAYQLDGKFRNMEIVRWTPETGPVIEPYRPRWTRIQEKIERSDKRAAGNEGRHYLEWLLKEICERTITGPPFRRSGRYTVAEFLTPAKKRVCGLIEGGPFRDKVLEGFSELEKTIIMGNLLSHDNPLIENVTIGEVERFCKAVHYLHDVFSCPECGGFIKYYQDLNILRCSNSRCENPVEIRC